MLVELKVPLASSEHSHKLDCKPIYKPVKGAQQSSAKYISIIQMTCYMSQYEVLWQTIITLVPKPRESCPVLFQSVSGHVIPYCVLLSTLPFILNSAAMEEPTRKKYCSIYLEENNYYDDSLQSIITI